jgi:hypothetical protein
LLKIATQDEWKNKKNDDVKRIVSWVDSYHFSLCGTHGSTETLWKKNLTLNRGFGEPQMLNSVQIR